MRRLDFPLSHKKPSDAFSHQMELEMHGHSPKKSLALAYRMKKKKCHGGEMAEGGETAMHEDELEKGMKKAFKSPGYAEGGFVKEEKESGYEPMPCENCGHMSSHAVENQSVGMEEEMDDDMIGHIMKKLKHYSEGGKVSNEDEPVVDSEEAEYDDLEKDDDLKEHYTGKNSGDEIGDEQEDEDQRDTVSQIMKSRKKKDKMPRPA